MLTIDGTEYPLDSRLLIQDDGDGCLLILNKKEALILWALVGQTCGGINKIFNALQDWVQDTFNEKAWLEAVECIDERIGPIDVEAITARLLEANHDTA